MNAHTRIVVLALLTIVLFAVAANAQGTGKYSVAIRGDLLVPLGTLGDLFSTGAGAAVTFGQKSSSDMLWEGVVEGARFTQGNAGKLYFDDLAVKLEYAGAGVQGTYYVGGAEGIFGGIANPYVLGSAVITRWSYVRGEHATDTTGLIVVPEFSQQDWSMKIGFGAGIEAYPAESISVYAQASYAILIGELWPTLALRLEGVSGMQMIQASAGIRVWF